METKETITPEEVAERNKSLQIASKVIFGESAELRIVNPKSLSLLKHNARYFKKDQFKQLVENLKKDQRLSGTPLCHTVEDGKLEVLSGNHRVEASVEAGIPWILVIVDLGDLSENEQIAVQLSHNSLVGVDDDQILAELWNKIDDIKMKCYAGLSSETVEQLKKIKLVSFTTPQIRTKQVSFAFTETEVEVITDILDELGKITADSIHLSHIDQFPDFFNLIQDIKKKENIKNGSLAVLRMVELASSALAAKQVAV